MDLSPKQFADIVTLTRSGTATRVNASGLIEAVAANTPRLDYDPVSRQMLGLLLEEGRTNLALQSEAFDNASWTKASMTASTNAAVSPDGNTTAEKLIPDNAISLSAASVLQPFSKAASALAYTFSIFAKASEFNRIQLFVNDSSTTANRGSVTVSLVDGSITSAASAIGTFTAASAVVANYGNGWFRVALTVTSSTETSIQARAYASDSLATAGNGTSGILIWGAQLEQVNTASSYIPTTTTTVARGSDLAVIGSGVLSPVYNQNEGTVVAIVQPAFFGAINPARIFELHDGSANNRIGVQVTTARVVQCLIDLASVRQNTFNFVNKWFAGSTVKLAAAFAGNDMAFAIDGAIATSSAAAAVPAVISQLSLGHPSYLPTQVMNGWIKSLRYFPNRLPNATLQALTA